VQHGEKVVASYIGKACETFAQEIFQPHKINHYNQALKNRSNGRAIIVFLYQKHKRRPNRTAIDVLETLLIQQAVRRTIPITNKQKTLIQELKIQGIQDFKTGKKPRGKSNTVSLIFRKMMKF